MKVIAYGVVAVATALAAGLAGPVWIEASAGLYDSWGYLLVIVLFYAAVIFGLAGALAHLFLRLALAGERADLATRMALGETRSSILSAAHRQGWRIGAALAVPAMVIGATVRQSLPNPGAGPTAVLDGKLNGWALVAVVSVGVVGALTTMIALVTAKAAATRETPAAAAASAVTDEDFGARRRPAAAWPRQVRWSLIALVVAALTIQAVNRVQPVDPWAIEDLSSRSWLMVVENVALTVTWLAALWLAYVITYSLARLGIAAAAARLARSVGSGGRAIAADALGRLSGTGRRIVAASAVIAALFTASMTSSGHTGAVGEAMDPATPAAFVLSTDPKGDIRPAGWESTPLDPDRLAALVADERVDVVRMGRFLSEVTFQQPWGTDEQQAVATQDQLFALIDGEGLPGLEALERLGLADGVLLKGDRWALDLAGSEYYTGPTELEGQGTTVSGYSLWSQLPAPITTAAWLEDAFGPAPVAGAAAFPSDGFSRSDAAQAVAEHFPEGTAWTLSMGGVFGWESAIGFDPWLAGVGFVLTVLLVASLSATSVKLRRRDLATMAALGGSPRSLASAPAWEAAVLAGASYMAGALVGITFAVVTVNPFLLSPGAPLDAGLIGWHLLPDLGAVPWAWLGAGLVVLVGASAVVARALGATMTGRTPVEELRTAEKEGVR